jgi:hypothetical protein
MRDDGRADGVQAARPLIASRLSHAGYLYLFGSCRTGHVKLGFSRNPLARARTVAAQHGAECLLLHAFICTHATWGERRAHSWFSEQAKGQEWFDLADGQVDALCAVGRWEVYRRLTFGPPAVSRFFPAPWATKCGWRRTCKAIAAWHGSACEVQFADFTDAVSLSAVRGDPVVPV